MSSVTPFFSKKKQQVKVVIGAVSQGAQKVKGQLMAAKDSVVDKASLLLVALNGFGSIAMAKLVEAKNYIVNKVKQIIAWGKALFVFKSQVEIAA